MESAIKDFKDLTKDEFVKILNTYGKCIDFSSHEERNKTTNGIYVGLVKRIKKPIRKGLEHKGHRNHDSNVIFTTNLVASNSEHKVIRIVFVGNIVQRLTEIGLKEGDAIAVLKPKFFYAHNIASLTVGPVNVVAWICKNLKAYSTRKTIKMPQENVIDLTKSDVDQYVLSCSDDTDADPDFLASFSNTDVTRLNEAEKGTSNEILSDSDETNTSGSKSLKRDHMIYRSTPINVEISANGKNLGNQNPRRSIFQNEQECNNITSQNTAVAGSSHINKVCEPDEFRRPFKSKHNHQRNICDVNHMNCSHSNQCNRTIHLNKSNVQEMSFCRHNTLPCSSHHQSHCHNNFNCSQEKITCCTFDHSCHSRPHNKCCFQLCGRVNNCCPPMHHSCSCEYIRPLTCSMRTCSDANNCCRCHSECTHNHNHWHPSKPHCSSPGKSCRVQTCSKACECIPCSSPPKVTPCCSNSNDQHQHENIAQRSPHKTVPVRSNCLAESTPFKSDSHNQRIEQWVQECRAPQTPPEIAIGPPSIISSSSSEKSAVPSTVHSCPTRTVNHPKDTSGKISMRSLQVMRPLLQNSSQTTQCNNKQLRPYNPKKKKKLFNKEDNYSIITEKTVSSEICVEESTPFDSESTGAGTAQHNVPRLPLAKDKTTLDQRPSKESNCADDTGRMSVDITETEQCSKEGPSNTKQHSSEETFPSLKIDSLSGEKVNPNNSPLSGDENNDCGKDNNEPTCENPKLNQGISASPEDDEKSDSNACISLSLSDYARIKESGVNEDVKDVGEKDEDTSNPMDCDALEGSEEQMELVSETALKKRKKSTKRKKKSKKPLIEVNESSDCSETDKSNQTIDLENETASAPVLHETASSSTTYYDAKSQISPQSEKWCVKNINEISFCPKTIAACSKLFPETTLKAPFKPTLFERINICGIIISIHPNIEENPLSILQGICHEECKKSYQCDKMEEIIQVDSICPSCRLRCHLICPKCLKAGLKSNMCLYFSFEIHVLQGDLVFRIEVAYHEAINFLGCTPSVYLRCSEKVVKKLRNIIPSEPVNPEAVYMLKGTAKAKCVKGNIVLCLDKTSLRENLILNGRPVQKWPKIK